MREVQPARPEVLLSSRRKFSAYSPNEERRRVATTSEEAMNKPKKQMSNNQPRDILNNYDEEEVAEVVNTKDKVRIGIPALRTPIEPESLHVKASQ